MLMHAVRVARSIAVAILETQICHSQQGKPPQIRVTYKYAGAVDGAQKTSMMRPTSSDRTSAAESKSPSIGRLSKLPPEAPRILRGSPRRSGARDQRMPACAQVFEPDLRRRGRNARALYKQLSASTRQRLDLIDKICRPAGESVESRPSAAAKSPVRNSHSARLHLDRKH